MFRYQPTPFKSITEREPSTIFEEEIWSQSHGSNSGFVYVSTCRDKNQGETISIVDLSALFMDGYHSIRVNMVGERYENLKKSFMSLNVTGNKIDLAVIESRLEQKVGHGEILIAQLFLLVEKLNDMIEKDMVIEEHRPFVSKILHGTGCITPMDGTSRTWLEQFYKKFGFRIDENLLSIEF